SDLLLALAVLLQPLQAALDLPAQPSLGQIAAADSVRKLGEVQIDLLRGPAAAAIVPDHDVEHLRADRLAVHRRRSDTHVFLHLLDAELHPAQREAGPCTYFRYGSGPFSPQQRPLEQPIDAATPPAPAPPQRTRRPRL